MMDFGGGWCWQVRDIRRFEKYCEMLQGFFLPEGNGLLGNVECFCRLLLRLIEKKQAAKHLMVGSWQ